MEIHDRNCSRSGHRKARLSGDRNDASIWAQAENRIKSLSKSLSVIVTVYQKEYQIGTVIEGIIHNTITPFQLVMVYDGCTDRSEAVVNEVLERCSGLMRDLKVVYTPDVNEVCANNAGMQAADGDYLVIMQDDMWIVESGWERRLVLPLETWDDVFAVSAGNAHSFSCSPPPNRSVTYTCTMNAERDIFRIRDGVNRGPIAFCARTMKQLDYLDEAFAPLYFDEMDLCMRAYRQFHKVCGVYDIVWRNLRGTVHVPRSRDVELSTGGMFYEACDKNVLIYWDRHHSYLNRSAKHDEDRPLAFEPATQIHDLSNRLCDTKDSVGHSIDPATHYNRIGMEMLRKDNRQAAFDAFTNSVKIEPSNVMAISSLGMLYWGNRQVGNALKCLISGLRVRPHSRRPTLELVRILTELKQMDNAENLLKFYLAYDPCDKEMVHLYEKLRQKSHKPSADGKLPNEAEWKELASGGGF